MKHTTKPNLMTTIKTILFAGFVSATVSSVQAAQAFVGPYAQGHLLVGLTTTAGSDFIADLGPASSALVNGNQWNLTNSLPTNLRGYTNTSWGVVGVSATGGLTYSTAITGQIPLHVANPSAFGGLVSQAGGLGGNIIDSSGYAIVPASAEGNASWNNGTVSGIAPSWASAYCNPNDTTPASYSTWSEDFYSTAIGNSGAQTLLGSFTLATNGILTFNTVGGGSSANAYLTSLVVSPALTFSPAFASNVLSYAATEIYNSTPTVTVINADVTATNRLIYGGTTNLLASGVASSGLALTLGVTNVVKVQVTAQDGTTVNNYQVNIIQQPNLTQPTLTNSVSGGTNLVLTWPTDHLGYSLLTQTNNLNKGVSGNTNDWAKLAGSAAITTTNLPINKGATNAYYRLVYP